MIEFERLIRDFDERVTAMGIAAVASRAGVDRSAVWRLRKGEVRLLSKGVRRMCKAAGLNADDYVKNTLPQKSPKLMKALADTWDGSTAQEDAICSVLRALRRVPRVVVSRKSVNGLPPKRITN